MNKNVFVKTENVKSFVALSDDLEASREKERMALVYGKPGIGKTETAMWLALNRRYVFLRAKAAWSVHWFLEELVSELGEAPANTVADMFRQAMQVLVEKPRIIMIDEVDHMLRHGELIETVRDLHDSTGNPFILIGMENAEHRIKRFPHIYDRFRRVLHYKPANIAEIKNIFSLFFSEEISNRSAKLIKEASAGYIRRIKSIFFAIDHLARVNKASPGDEGVIKRSIERRLKSE